ncbi:MAG: DUF4366 domain-containing protein [Oscillospiraceae bacterium]|nr:MAG: DUF4366 domain-containing protein [Oscillospiraceae bacterium]
MWAAFSVTAFAQTPDERTTPTTAALIVETEPQTPYPGRGNATLVDDIDGDAAEDKQFIVVKRPKGGNYFFYIIVDRAAEGEKIPSTFLNQVDESDLMATYRGGTDRSSPARLSATVPRKCKAGEVNTACPVCSVNMDSCTGKDSRAGSSAEPEKAPKNSMGGLFDFPCCGTSWRRRSFYYVKFMKPKSRT